METELTITLGQLEELQEIVGDLVQKYPPEKRCGFKKTYMAILRRKFKISRIRDLPRECFEQATEYIKNVSVYDYLSVIDIVPLNEDISFDLLEDGSSPAFPEIEKVRIKQVDDSTDRHKNLDMLNTLLGMLNAPDFEKILADARRLNTIKKEREQAWSRCYQLS